MTTESGKEGPHSAVIHFVPTTCAVVFMDRGRERSYPFVEMGLKVASDSEVEAHDGRSLNDIAWSVEFYDSSNATNEKVLARGAIGVLRHNDNADHGFEVELEAGHMWAAVRPELFRFLQDVALSGKSPSSISITAVDLEYGPLPDGNPITWDTKKFEWVDITSVDVAVGTRPGNDPNDHGVNDHRPLDVSDLREAVRNATTAIAEHLRKSNTLLGLLLAASIVILLIVLLRR